MVGTAMPASAGLITAATASETPPTPVFKPTVARRSIVRPTAIAMSAGRGRRMNEGRRIGASKGTGAARSGNGLCLMTASASRFDSFNVRGR